jgi:hypothetical protein
MFVEKVRSENLRWFTNQQMETNIQIITLLSHLLQHSMCATHKKSTQFLFCAANKKLIIRDAPDTVLAGYPAG